MADQVRATRRHVVQGVAVVGVAGPLLVSCGDDGGGSGGGSGGGDGNIVTGVGTVIRCGCHGSGFSTEDGSIVNGPAAGPLDEKPVSVDGDRVTVDGTELGAAGDIPVGGGAIFSDDKVVVTQPTQGTFKAFTAVCTHQGCVVSSVEEA